MSIPVVVILIIGMLHSVACTVTGKWGIVYMRFLTWFYDLHGLIDVRK